MIADKRVLAIIPARGGSKGIPDKNLKILGDKPLIAWTIQSALKSSYIDQVIVSTDSDRIAEVAREYGAEVPFKRPDEFASDTATASDVITHAITHFEKTANGYDWFVYLQPTSPFRTTEQIDLAIAALSRDSNAETVVSVREVTEQPMWMKTVSPDGYLNSLLEAESEHIPRQGLGIVYILNGAIFVSTCSGYVKNHSFYFGNTLPYIMNLSSSVDIDTPEDWQTAETLLQKYSPK